MQSIRQPSIFHHRSYHPIAAHQALSAVGLHGLAVRHYSAKGEILSEIKNDERIATVTVDRFLERPTIREETLELVRGFVPKGAPPTYRELSRMNGETFAYHAVRGYWLVR